MLSGVYGGDVNAALSTKLCNPQTAGDRHQLFFSPLMFLKKGLFILSFRSQRGA